MCGKNYQMHGVQIPRKWIESVHFESCLSFSLKTPGRIFVEICFTQAERGRENYDFLYQNSIKKYKDDMEH